MLARPLRVGAAIAAILIAPSALAGDGTLTVGISQFASTLHPSIEASSAKSYILEMGRRPFTTFDADWELICMLCTELPTLENGGAVRETTPDGKDGIAVTYTIREGSAWGDGVPLTTADVVFAWEVGRHPQSAFDNIELYRSIWKIDATDERTFTLHVDKVDFRYNSINDLHPLPAHLERAVFEAGPVEYPSRSLYVTDPLNPGLWFGPFRPVEIESGAHVVMEPNPTWYGAPPHFDRIVVRTIENTSALEANLLSGAIDMVAGEVGVTLDQALDFEARHGADYTILYKPGLIYEHIDLNLDNPLLEDKRVRQALLLAVDRETMVRQLFQGHQPVAVTSVSPLDWVFADDVATYPYDPALAAALLEEAGFAPGPDGIRQNAAGERLSFELMTTAGNQTRELVQQVLQSAWAEVGIEATIRNEPARVFFGDTTSKRQFTAMAMFAWISSPENVPRTTLHSSHIPTEANNWSGQNYTGYSNPEMDRLIEETDIELDPEKRRLLWHQIQALYADELPALPLYYRSDAYLLPKWLEGLVPTGHQYGTTLWVEDWRRSPGN
jgi:peptide/nickel transport system substrate-binding protein